MLKQMRQFRTWLARLIDPEYAKVENLADCMIKVSKELELDLARELDRGTHQLFELGKYKANYRLLADALKDKKVHLTVTDKNGRSWSHTLLEATSTIERLFTVLTEAGQSLPHKDLK